jgi:hypothetical protein
VIPEVLIVTLGLGATLFGNDFIFFREISNQEFSFPISTTLCFAFSTILATRSFTFPISRTLCFAFAAYPFMLGMFNCNLGIRDLRRCIEGGFCH